MVDKIEQEFFDNTNIALTGHLDPIVVNDEEVNTLRAKVSECVTSIDERFSIHDFRMTDGENRVNLIFDIVVPCAMTENERETLVSRISAALKATDEKYFAVIKVDNDYASVI
jgi:hypothetical protein